MPIGDDEQAGQAGDGFDLDLPPPGTHPLRRRLGMWIESPGPRHFVVALIVVNAIVLGLQTSEAITDAIGGALAVLNGLILAVFVVELAIKIFASGWGFFRSGWNVFDLIVVGISMVPGTGPFQILRSLRVLRILRLLSQVRRLRELVDAILRALPGLGWTSFLLALVFYVFAVMGTELFGERFPEFFGGLGESLFSMFQIMTLEAWASDIARPVLETYPWAWLYFVPFILITTFMVLNLFIAIMVSATQSLHDDTEQVERRQTREELRQIREQLEFLTRQIEKAGRRHGRPDDSP